MERKISIPLLLSLVLFWSLTFGLGSIKLVEIGGPRYLAPPPEYLEYFSFGFRESLADSLWLRWIQDNDVCQTYSGVSLPTADLKPSADFENPRHKVCDNSWSFKMLDAITRLSPKFKMPYEFGAITLAVLTEDYAGSTVIFNRAVANYPNDWDILFRAAYHFLYDMNDLERAAELFQRAADLGAPNWLNLLAARLLTKSGKIEVGLATLRRYRETIKDNPAGVKRVSERIDELERKLQVNSPDSLPNKKDSK